MDEECRSFENAIPFFEAAKISTQTARAQLQKSGERLGFKIDPFLLPISSHRQIRELNENAYMDWFAWVLDVACQNTSQPLSLCAKILALNEDAIQASRLLPMVPVSPDMVISGARFISIGNC